MPLGSDSAIISRVDLAAESIFIRLSRRKCRSCDTQTSFVTIADELPQQHMTRYCLFLPIIIVFVHWYYVARTRPPHLLLLFSMHFVFFSQPPLTLTARPLQFIKTFQEKYDVFLWYLMIIRDGAIWEHRLRRISQLRYLFFADFYEFYSPTVSDTSRKPHQKSHVLPGIPVNYIVIITGNRPIHAMTRNTRRGLADDAAIIIRCRLSRLALFHWSFSLLIWNTGEIPRYGRGMPEYAYWIELYDAHWVSTIAMKALLRGRYRRFLALHYSAVDLHASAAANARPISLFSTLSLRDYIDDIEARDWRRRSRVPDISLRLTRALVMMHCIGRSLLWRRDVRTRPPFIAWWCCTIFHAKCWLRMTKSSHEYCMRGQDIRHKMILFSRFLAAFRPRWLYWCCFHFLYFIIFRAAASAIYERFEPAVIGRCLFITIELSAPPPPRRGEARHGQRFMLAWLGAVDISRTRWWRSCRFIILLFDDWCRSTARWYEWWWWWL